MSESVASVTLPRSVAARALLCASIDPLKLGGVILKGGPGPNREASVAELKRLQPASTPFVKIPAGVAADRLLGGLDVGATMASGRPVFASGLLASANGGFALVSMAERLAPDRAAILADALDHGEVRIERDGTTRRSPANVAVIAFDESIDDEALDARLNERIALTVELSQCRPEDLAVGGFAAGQLEGLRNRARAVDVDDEALRILAATAAAFAIDSLRALSMALAVARIAAALNGRDAAVEEDLRYAAELVFPQRARALPTDPSEPAEPPPADDSDTVEESGSREDIPDDVIVDAVRAALPPRLLEALATPLSSRRSKAASGRHGPRQRGNRRGRPLSARPGELAAGSRLNVLATLKAAAPWQRIRRRESSERALEIRKDDIHVCRFEEHTETTTIFAVDASGSQAAERLAEVKGAIELLLNDCYVRRDQVALIAFRGQAAESLLPPTRALARVKRSLRALPGGGGTPLASGLDAARLMATAERNHGRKPTVVLLTDGRANVTRDGRPDAGEAEREALQAGRMLAADEIRCLLVDASRRPRPRARKLADAMLAEYVPLPRASAASISATVEAAR